MALVGTESFGEKNLQEAVEEIIFDKKQQELREGVIRGKHYYSSKNKNIDFPAEKLREYDKERLRILNEKNNTENKKELEKELKKFLNEEVEYKIEFNKVFYTSCRSQQCTCGTLSSPINNSLTRRNRVLNRSDSP